jgi:hypothetical protein
VSLSSADFIRAVYRVGAFRRAAGHRALPDDVMPGVAAALSLPWTDAPDLLTLCRAASTAALLRGIEARPFARWLAGAFGSPDDLPGAGAVGHGHPAMESLGLLSPVALPGVSIEVAAGAAIAFRMKGEPRVAVVVDDLSSADSGDWHEGLNFAAVRRAPLVVVLRTEPVEPRWRTSVMRRAEAYGVQVDRLPIDPPDSWARRLALTIEAVREDPVTTLVEVPPAGADAIERFEARMTAPGPVGRPEIEPEDLARWAEEAEAEAAAAWEGLTPVEAVA